MIRDAPLANLFIANQVVMTVDHVENPSSTSRAGVAWSDGVVRLRDENLFGKDLGDQCVFFLRHIFALKEVAWVEIDSKRSTASVGYDSGRFGLSKFLERMAAALRGEVSPYADVAYGPLKTDLARSGTCVRIMRFGATLTTWDVIHDRLGRIRLRHEAIRGDRALANRLQGAIENVSGVIECAVWPVTGSVLIRFEPNRTSAWHLLRILDQARHTPASPGVMPLNSRHASFALANSSLALAVVSELAIPFLTPASAVVLVASNLQTFRSAGRQLLRRQFGLPVLYTSIIAATLISGQFIASAAMSWMFTFWSRRYRRELTSARRRLLGQITHQPTYVRLATSKANSIDVEVAITDVQQNDVILVSAGERVPVDGRVIQGRGLVDERMLLGLEGLSRKQPDDEVFAGSTLRIGQLQIQVLRHGSKTKVAQLAQVALAATTAPDGSRTPTLHGERFAEQTVAATMAIAGLGLLVGDVSTAGAILRPDYATGPGLAFPLETLQAIALCLRHGILIREPAAIERLATADLLILEHHISLERTELEVGAIQVFPGHFEDDLLRFAATAFHDLNDERNSALRSACRTRKIELLDLEPTEFTTDLTLLQGNDRIKIGDLGPRARNQSRLGPDEQDGPRKTEPEAPSSLMVGVNGQVAGLIHFRRSDRLEATSALQRLRIKRNLQIGIISDQSHTSLASLAKSLKADFHVGGLSPDARIHFLQNCRHRGFKTAYVGDCRLDPRAAEQAHVAISLAGMEDNCSNDESGPICLLQPQITKLSELWEIACIHERRLRVARGYALIPNLACIAGAFIWGFTSLESVIVTNLGTYGVYSRTAASIRSLERQLIRWLDGSQSGKPKTLIQTKAQKNAGG